MHNTVNYSSRSPVLAYIRPKQHLESIKNPYGSPHINLGKISHSLFKNVKKKKIYYFNP